MLKKTSLSLLVLILVSGLAMFSCGGGGGGGGGNTYRAAVLVVPVSVFNSTFSLSANDGTAPTIMSGSLSDLTAKINSLMPTYMEDGDEGISYADLEYGLNDYAGGPQYATVRSEIMAELNSNGFVVAYMGLASEGAPGQIGVIAAMRE